MGQITWSLLTRQDDSRELCSSKAPSRCFCPGRVVRMGSILPCPPALTYNVGMPVLGTLCSKALHWEYLVINAAELFNTNSNLPPSFLGLKEGAVSLNC